MTIVDVVKKAGGATEVAKALGCSRAGVYLWTSGRSQPLWDAMVKLCALANVDPRDVDLPDKPAKTR